MVALRQNSKDYNIEVKPGSIYQCDTDKGVAYLEPVSLGTEIEEDDARLKSFFGEVA